MAHFTEADPANAEASHEAAWATTTMATTIHSRLELRFLLQAFCLGNQTFSGHVNP
jgi:hypothetical protein